MRIGSSRFGSGGFSGGGTRRKVGVGGSQHRLAQLARNLLELIRRRLLRLRKTVDRAQFDRPQRHVRPFLRQRRQHHYRHRARAHQFLKKLQPVLARHFDVQCQYVGSQFGDHVPRFVRAICRADHDQILAAFKRVGEQGTHRHRVVDHEHFLGGHHRVLSRGRGKRVMRPRQSFRCRRARADPAPSPCGRRSTLGPQGTARRRRRSMAATEGHRPER